jgi:hypothetical protein
MQTRSSRKSARQVLSRRALARCAAGLVAAMSGVALTVMPDIAHVGLTPRVAAAVSGVARSGAAEPVPSAGFMSTRARPLAVTPQLLSYFDAVSCTSSVFCVAVGYSTDAAGHAKTLIESWDGHRWSLTKSPDMATSDYNQLYAVSCSSSVSCAAVGRAHDSGSGFQRTLTESWNGRSWAIVPSFDTSTHSDNVLDGVSCPRAGSCVAVGYAANTKIGVWRTLVESWNGRAWKEVSSSNASATENNFLLGVSCRSGSDCTAVGYHYKNRLHTLVESWDGHRWSIINSANALTTGNNILYAVSCVSRGACTAVGSFYVPAEMTPTNQNLIESWDGRRWALTRSPVTSATERNTLNGISCVANRDCVAVGTYLNHRNGFNQSLILTDSGSGWKITSSPNAGSSSRGEDNWLNGVYCVSRNNCTAVGYYTNTKAVSLTLIETWNGHHWTIANTANP